jgi:two-component system sensor histidine kinase FlrB
MNQMNVVTRETEFALADAFASFTSAASQLETSYRELQKEVNRLRQELEMRNLALAESLTENQSMRVALRRILDALPCGVIVLDDNGDISFLNRKGEEHLNVSKSGTRSAPAINEAARSRLAEIQSEVTPNGAEREIQCSGPGQTRWLAVRSSTMPAGSFVKSAGSRTPLAGQNVLISRDITTQKELQSKHEADQHLVALAEMSAVLAHEIRNPLGSMELLTGLLFGSEELTGEQRSWVEGLRAGVRSLSATVNNVLRYHSLGVSNLEPVQLSQVLRESVQFVQPLANQAGIKLHFIDELGEQKIAANTGELQQVVFNLALNAFRHTQKGGTVKLALRRNPRPNGDVAVVEVSDSGCGIRDEDVSRVFDAGFSTTGHSSGLGLAVCQKLVHQHGGSIAVDSRVGVGSTFRMEFPLV